MSKLFRAVTALLVTMMLAHSALAQPVAATPGDNPWSVYGRTWTASSATTLGTEPTGAYTTVYWSYTSVGTTNTVISEVSMDGGSTYNAIPSWRPTSSASGTSTSWTPTAGEVYQASIPALARFRLRVSAYTSGTVTAKVSFQAAQYPTIVYTTSASSSGQTVQGNVASGATDSGNPVKVGGVYRSTKPTLTDGQRGDVQLTTRGVLGVSIFGVDSQNGVVSALPNSDALSTSTNLALATQAFGYSYNGASLDRDFTCPSSAVINVAAAATTQLVALASSQIIRVCSFVISGDTLATTATFVYGTGANCGTGQVALTGAMRLPDEGSIALSGMNGSLFRSIASNALCLTAATGAVTGFVTYAQY